MMRRTTIAATAMLAGCVSTGVVDFDQRANQVQPGMKVAEVAAIMGTPKNRQFSGRQEALQWCETSYMSGSADSYFVGYFYDGALIATSTYRNRARGTCESFFQPIQWIPPDRIIELRHR